MLERKITYYNGNKDVKANYCTVKEALGRIRNNPDKDKIAQIRLLSDKKRRNDTKGSLRAYSFSGEFKRRGNEFLLHHSGILCLDFDDVDPKTTKERLSKDEHIWCAFTSPSGNGVKALVKVPTEIENDEQHKNYFRAINDIYPEIDKTGDVARLCYESHDPEIYYNDKAKVFTKTREIQYERVEVLNEETDTSEIYQKLKIWLENNGEFFTEGNRNQYIYKLACATNRFGIHKETASGYMYNDFVVGGSDFSENEFRITMNSAYKNQMQFATSKFEKNEIVLIQSSRVVSEEILDEESDFKDIILISDIEKDMMHEFENGIQLGETTHYPSLDGTFRMMRGELTLMHGIANFGKSAMMNQILINKAVFDNQRFAVFSPESYPPSDYFNNLIQTYIGKPVMSNSLHKHMSEKEYKKGIEFVKKHFYYVYPEEADPTPEYLLKRFRIMIHKHKVDGIVIDPYNQMYHDFSAREDQYLSKVLSLFKRFAVEENIFFLIIAHPNGRIETDSNGNAKAPWMSQISGGMMWANKCDNILCYHRPYFKTESQNPTCEFIAQKIKKQQRNGRPQTVEMNYDWTTFRFNEGLVGAGGGCPLDNIHKETQTKVALGLDKLPQSRMFDVENLNEDEAPF